MTEKKYKVGGMTCASCQSHVQKAVEKLEGVEEVNVNLLANNMTVKFDETKIDDNKIISSVKKAGYSASNYTETKINSKSNTENGKNLIVSAVFAIVVFYLGMGPMMNIPIPPIFSENPLILGITELLLTLVVVFLNRRYFSNGFKRLIKLSPNMDSLIAIGSSAALIYGIYIIYLMAYRLGNGQSITHYAHELYFESASTILVLVSFGKYLENKSKNKTDDAIKKMVDLAPKMATVLVDGVEKQIPAKEVKINDLVVIKKGMAAPVDGLIVEGCGSFDQSNITGESIPVFKELNAEVISSTILTTGYVVIKATKVGEDTTINTIIKLVEEAANSKAPISKLADKISFYFVPIVILIALISFVTFAFLETPAFAFEIGISVLVIACPCALGLATPVAIMVATGVAAKNKILIKNAEILEKTHKIKTIILDKTGTITEGKPKVTDIISFKDLNILNIAYSLELKSEHPLAQAIVEEAKDQKSAEVLDYESLAGLGISGRIGSQKYYIGNEKYLKQLKIDLEKNSAIINQLALEGKTPLLVADDKELIGIIAVKDTVKPSAKQAIKNLESLGIEVVMLTGDNAQTAKIIASEVGIKEVISDVLPAEKQEVVKRYQGQGKQVAMVGDGINDALALMVADIGIAIGNGSDIALDAADIILLSESLNNVYGAIKLSKRTINNIKGNLFWAFFYNAIGILLASGIFYYPLGIKLNPIISALAMSLSSVFVVTNALRLNTFKIKEGGNGNMEEIVLNVEGMMCKNCQSHVEKALNSISGVKKVSVNLKKKTAKVEGENLDKNQLIEAVKNAGYDAK